MEEVEKTTEEVPQQLPVFDAYPQVDSLKRRMCLVLSVAVL